MEYTQPLNSRSTAIVAVAAVLLVLAAVAVALRCFVRISMLRAFGWDDGLMVAALIAFFAFALDFAVGAVAGIGHKVEDFQTFSLQSGNPKDSIRALQQAMMVWWLGQMLYIWSAAIAKFSIALALLRIAVSRVYRYIIWAVIAAVLTITTIFWFVLLLGCRPISFFWGQIDPSTAAAGGKCMAPRSILIFAYCYSAFCIVIDLTLGILPAVLVWGLQMSSRAKRALTAILGLGAIASVAVIIRMPYLKYYTDSEFLYSTYMLVIWSIIETGSAIIAGSLITLKPLFRWFLEGTNSSYRRKSSGHPLSSLGGKRSGRKDEPKNWRPNLIPDDGQSANSSSKGNGTSVSTTTIGGAMHPNSSQENLTGHQKKDESQVTISVHHSFQVQDE